MPALEFFVVSSSIAIDQRSNRLSIFEVIEDLQPVRFPARIPHAVALTLWTLDAADQDQDFQAALRVSGPGLEEPAVFRQNFRGDGKSQRIIFQILSVPVLSSGTMLFEMLLNDERKASHQVRVAAADAAASEDDFLIYQGDN